MSYPTDKPTGNYSLREYNFAENDNKKLPMDEYLFKNGYKNADESEVESVPDAHSQNWLFDVLHRNLKYTLETAEENKSLLANKVATPTSIGQIKVGYGLEITSNGVLSVVKDVAEDANIISYDLPVGSYMLWAGNNTPEYFIEPKGQELLRSSYPDLWEFAQTNNLVADGNSYTSGKLFGNGDGSTTFVVFDIRGQFIRIANDSRAVGTYQEDALQTHTHTYRSDDNTRRPRGDDRTNCFTYDKYFETTGPNGCRVADETRPKNYALKLILKALPTPPSNAVPTGTVLDYTGNTAPDGYIVANGAELSRTQFSKLYNWAVSNGLVREQSQIPTTAHGFYGTGNGSTTFTIPDLRGVFKRNADLASNRGGTELGLYQSIGGTAGYPNFNSIVSIGSGYVAPQDGFIALRASTDRGANVRVGNFSLLYSYDTGDGQSSASIFFPVKKGNTISFDNTINSYFIPTDSSTQDIIKSVSILPIIKY